MSVICASKKKFPEVVNGSGKSIAPDLSAAIQVSVDTTWQGGDIHYSLELTGL